MNNNSITGIDDQNVNSLTAINGDEMALSEHIEEFSQRLIFSLIVLITAILSCFTDIKQIVKIFQAPAMGLNFYNLHLVNTFLPLLKLRLLVVFY